MRRHGLLMRGCAMMTLCCFLASCRAVLPEHFVETRNAFTPEELKSASTAPPKGAKTATFEAPYEDVFKAVTIGATQAQVNIVSSDKSTGFILGERLFQGEPKGAKNVFALLVKELKPKLTEVVLLRKGQGSCSIYTPGGHVALTISTLGLWLITGLPMLTPTENACKEIATFKYIDQENEALSTEIITFTRNNLFAAGVM